MSVVGLSDATLQAFRRSSRSNKPKHREKQTSTGTFNPHRVWFYVPQCRFRIIPNAAWSGSNNPINFNLYYSAVQKVCQVPYREKQSRNRNNGSTSSREEESILRRSAHGIQESAHAPFHQWDEQSGDRRNHRRRQDHPIDFYRAFNWLCHSIGSS